MDQDVGQQAERILEINPQHELFDKLKEIYNKEGNTGKLVKYSEVLYSLASMIEGFNPDDPVEFSDKVTELMIQAN